MSNASEKSKNNAPEEKKREDEATKVYCKACEESGLKVSSWEDFEAWQEYVDGKIDDNELVQRAKQEMEQFSHRFGKNIVIKEEQPVSGQPEQDKKERAKLANKTYKKVCEEAGMNLCFFSNFATWSDYVKGQMSESEFYEKAKLEVEKMTSETK